MCFSHSRPRHTPPPASGPVTSVSAGRFRDLGGFDETFNTSEDRELCDRWLARGFRMTYAPDAVVRHSHDLTLRSLWRQHFGYGRGAWRFHHARAARGEGRFKPDKDFYLKLLLAPSSQTRKTRAARLTALLIWSQLANTAGFFYERLPPTNAALSAVASGSLHFW